MRFCRRALPLLALAALGGCGAKPRVVTLPAPVRQTSPAVGKFEPGTIVAVRGVALGNAGTANAVLAALGQPPARAVPAQAVELIIRRQDGSVASVMQQPQAGPPFVPGEKIAIVEAAATVIHPQ